MSGEPIPPSLSDFWEGIVSESDQKERELKDLRANGRGGRPPAEMRSALFRSIDIGLQLAKQNKDLSIRNSELNEELSVYRPLVEEMKGLKEDYESYTDHLLKVIAALNAENAALRKDLAANE